jgi:hypothetical protein
MEGAGAGRLRVPRLEMRYNHTRQLGMCHCADDNSGVAARAVRPSPLAPRGTPALIIVICNRRERADSYVSQDSLAAARG